MSLCGNAWLQHGDPFACRANGCECGSGGLPDPAQDAAGAEEGSAGDRQGGDGQGACASAGCGAGEAEGEVVRLKLPWPPTANHYYRHVGPRVLISKAGREYRETVADLLEGGYDMITGRIGVTIYCHVPDNRKRDLGNIEKCLCDSLTKAGIWEDDSQIDDLRLVRASKVEGGMVRVEIREIA